MSQTTSPTTGDPSAPAVTDQSPLSRPIHRLQLGADAPPWRDNAFLIFWDPEAEVYGSAHVSTSPNAEGRLARFSLTAGGRTVEVIEPLERGSFASASITFDLDGEVSVKTERLQARVKMTPRFVHADYAEGGLIPSVGGQAPLAHYQQGLTVDGEATLDGAEHRFAGAGLRDRTWGYRDESASMDEYIALDANFPSHFVTLVRMRATSGTDRAEGYELSDRAAPLSGFGVTRDAAGLFVAAHVTRADTGEEIEIRSTGRRAGFWVPMGVERRGPCISTYDEFLSLRTSDGEEGFGIVEHAIVRKIF